MSWKRRSYEAVPALRVRGPHLRRALRMVTLAWMFGVVWISAASGSHFKVFATSLGFGDFAFGLLGTLPFLATFGQLLAALMIERTGLLKYQFIQCAAVHRLLWLAVAAVPLVLPRPSALAVAAVLVILSASSFMGALSAPAWLTWMGALIPRRIRGRYFATRERLALCVQMVVVIGLGVLMDRVYRAGDLEVSQVGMWAISAILAGGAVFGLIDILMFHRVPEVLPPPSEEDARAPSGQGARGGVTLRRFLLEPLRDGAFRSYVLYGATMTFSLTVAGWFYWRNAMENLGFGNLATNVLFLVIGPLAGIWASRRWGRAIDRWGRRPVLIFCTAGAALSALSWLLIPPKAACPAFLTRAVAWWLAALGQQDWAAHAAEVPVTPYLLAALSCVIGGATWSGINLAQTGIVLGFSDGSGRSRYVAASSVLISTGGMLGGLIGGSVATALASLQAHPIHWGPFLWNNWHATFALSFAARLVTILWLVRMPDPGAASVRSLARYMGMNVYNGVVTRLFYTLRVFGWQQPGRRKGQPGPTTRGPRRK
ncbi:MAG TPA: MFS transporter [Phycisphaerae bacterium]|nr:MFS transporter [Phycisphaerae bacterium]